MYQRVRRLIRSKAASQLVSQLAHLVTIFPFIQTITNSHWWWIRTGDVCKWSIGNKVLRASSEMYIPGKISWSQLGAYFKNCDGNYKFKNICRWKTFHLFFQIWETFPLLVLKFALTAWGNRILVSKLRKKSNNIYLSTACRELPGFLEFKTSVDNFFFKLEALLDVVISHWSKIYDGNQVINY